MRLLQCPKGHPCSAGKPLGLLPWQRSLLPSLALGMLIFHSFQNSSDNRQGLKQKDAFENEASHTCQADHGPTSPWERVQSFKEALAIPHPTHTAPSPGLQHLCPGRGGLGAPWNYSPPPSVSLSHVFAPFPCPGWRGCPTDTALGQRNTKGQCGDTSQGDNIQHTAPGSSADTQHHPAPSQTIKHHEMSVFLCPRTVFFCC